MKNIKWLFLLYSCLAVISMMGVGIAVGLRNPLLAFVFIAILIIIMGIGFQTKKKQENQGTN